MKILDYIFAWEAMAAKASEMKEFVYSSTSDDQEVFLTLLQSQTRIPDKDLSTCHGNHKPRAHEYLNASTQELLLTNS